MTARDTDLFERAVLAANILDVAETARLKLKRSGKEHRGPCPFGKCGGASHPFVVRTGKQRWKCYVCSPRWGDAVDLEHRLHSTGDETMADAARRLLGLAPKDPAECARRARRREAEAKAAEESDAWKAELAARIWREAVPASGTLVQTYLEHRGLYGPVLARMVGLLRFHPRCYWGGHPQFGVFLPAMVAMVTAAVIVNGSVVVMPTGGVHCTYLHPKGIGKASRDPAKKMWGPQGVIVDGRPVPGGVWLTRPDAPGELDVGEGIESSASFSILRGGDMQAPRRTLATLSLDRMQGGEWADRDGRLNMRNPEGDPARPAVTWPEDPAHPWGAVNIGVDRDMKPMRLRGFVTSKSGRVRDMPFWRDQDERARVCAVLATAAWRGALSPDSRTQVRAAQPGPGRDFNVELMARAEAASGRAARDSAKRNGVSA